MKATPRRRASIGALIPLVWIVLVSGCASGQVNIEPYSAALDAESGQGPELRELDVTQANQPTPMTFQTDDVVRMLVWGYPELTHAGPVQQNGTVVLPLVGEVVALGKSAIEVRDEVIRRLRGSLTDAPLTLEREDVVKLVVLDHDDLTHVAEVQMDGMITFPLVGSLPAVGRTIDDVRIEVTKALEPYIPAPRVSILPQTMVKKTVANPLVSILPEQLRLRTVAVVGEVNAPGLIPIHGELRVMDALAQAGYTDDAELNSIVVIRSRQEAPQYVGLRLRDFIKATAPDQNIYLRADDIVIVPKTTIARVGDFVRNFFVNTQPVFNWWIALQNARYATEFFTSTRLLNEALFSSIR